MARLEDLTPGALVKGVLPDGSVAVIQAKWYGSNVLELTYKDTSGNPRCELLYRDREPTLEIASAGLPWSFDADGANFRLASEAKRIRMAYLFDPLLALGNEMELFEKGFFPQLLKITSSPGVWHVPAIPALSSQAFVIFG